MNFTGGVYSGPDLPQEVMDWLYANVGELEHGQVVPIGDSGWYYQYDETSGDWNMLWEQNEDADLDTMYDIPEEIWHAAPAGFQQFGWEGWNSLPHWIQEQVIAQWGDPSEWAWFDEMWEEEGLAGGG